MADIRWSGRAKHQYRFGRRKPLSGRQCLGLTSCSHDPYGDPVYIDIAYVAVANSPRITRGQIGMKKIRGIKRHPPPNTGPNRSSPPTNGGGDDRRHRQRSFETGEKRTYVVLPAAAGIVGRKPPPGRTAAGAGQALPDETSAEKCATRCRCVLGPALNRIYFLLRRTANYARFTAASSTNRTHLYREFAGCMNPAAGLSPLSARTARTRQYQRVRRFGALPMSVMMVIWAITPTRQTRGDGNGTGSRSPNTREARANSRGWDFA